MDTAFSSLMRAEGMEILLRELKKLVSFWGWTYGVIWTIGPDHRTPVWYLGYFDEEKEREIGQAQRFESIYKRCQFTAVRPGYASMAWRRQSPYWWLRQVMEPVPTDEKKELFLTQANIQTLACFPGLAPADGTGYCVELASTSWVPENEVSKTSIRDFISTSIAPYMTGAPTAPESYPLLQELLGAPVTAAQLLEQEQDTAILGDITSQAAIHGEEELGFGNIGRRDIEPYYPWTMSSSHSVSADHFPRFGDSDFPTFDVGSFGLGGTSIPALQEPFQNQELPEWPPSTSSNPHGSRKDKEILADPKPFPLPTSPSLLQLEYLEKLRRHSTAQNSSQVMLPSAGSVSSGLQLSSAPRDSAWFPFQPHRQSQLSTRSSKKQAMIYQWVTALAPRMRERDGASPAAAALSSDPRSPNSRMLDQQAAVIHKHAERRRRSNMNNKLRTLISIVPTIEKKDKISVLSSTIDYIRQLTSRLSSFENKDKATTPSILATTSRVEEDALVMNMDSTLVVSTIGDGPNVVVEDSSDCNTWLIKVQADYHSWSLLHILNKFQELGFEVLSMDYWTMNGRVQAHVSIKHSEKSNTSRSDLKETLSRVLESGNNLLSDTN